MIKRRTFIASTLATAAAASLSRQACSAVSSQKLFDTHCHFYTYEPDKYPFNAASARYGAERMIAKARATPMTPEVVFRFWDVVGVEMGTGVQYNSTYGTDNSYLLDVCRQYPKRALPVVILSPTDAATPDTLRKWAKENRLAAVRYSGSPPASGDAPFFSAEARNMWATANELGLCVVLMILGNNTGPALKKVAEHADRYPNVKIALDHVAFLHPEKLPDTFGMLPEHKELAAHKNVYYKFTSFLISEMEGYAKEANKPMAELKPILENLVSVYGADHLCWGSDHGNVEVDDVAYAKRFRRCLQRTVGEGSCGFLPRHREVGVRARRTRQSESLTRRPVDQPGRYLRSRSGPCVSVLMRYTEPRPTTYSTPFFGPENARFCGCFGSTITPSGWPCGEITCTPIVVATKRRPFSSTATPSAPAPPNAPAAAVAGGGGSASFAKSWWLVTSPLLSRSKAMIHSPEVLATNSVFSSGLSATPLGSRCRRPAA